VWDNLTHGREVWGNLTLGREVWGNLPREVRCGIT
jgi:hypothetical protein